MLDEFAHDLRSNSLVISFAAHLLKNNLGPFDQEEFGQVLSRNLANAQAMLDGLMNRSWLEADERTVPIKAAIMALSALLSCIQADLINIASPDIQHQINQLIQIANRLVG